MRINSGKTIRFVYLILACAALLVGITAGVLIVHSKDLPNVATLEEYKPSATTRIFAEDGQLLGEFYMEDRIPIPLARVPKHVINAFLATEDPRFYRHSGIDVSGIFRALYANIRARKVTQGGSSITQQLTKMLFLTPERSLSRKIKEAVISLQIERRYSKDEILNLYLNQVYLGGGAYGVQAASLRYFGKDVEQLTVAEGAMLAGLPAAPNKYSPIHDHERALGRRSHVLNRMETEGFITQAQADTASAEPLTAKPSHVLNSKAPYFVEYVRQRLEDKYGTTTLYRGGLNVHTTLNIKMQEVAEAGLKKALDAVSKRHPRADKQIQGAFLAMEPSSGAIRVMIGGTDYEKSEFNRAVQALRQPGSSFKPIVYTAAVEAKGYTPEDIIEDTPVSYPGAKPGVPWRPSNFENKFEGAVTLRHALAHSINIVAIKLMAKTGIDTTIGYARKLGITSPMQPYLPLALGASDTTLIEMTSAYAVFDNGGMYNTPSAITKVTDREGGVIDEFLPEARQAITAETAATMVDLLAGVVKFGTGFEARTLGRPAAGKTGTTSSYNDAWFIGFVPSMVAGVWVGYDDHKPIGNKETGARAALPAWLDFMKGYVKEFNIPSEDFPKPPKPGFRNVSGGGVKVVTEPSNTPARDFEAAPAGAEPIKE